jgi:hypothetical protein
MDILEEMVALSWEKRHHHIRLVALVDAQLEKEVPLTKRFYLRGTILLLPMVESLERVEKKFQQMWMPSMKKEKPRMAIMTLSNQFLHLRLLFLLHLLRVMRVPLLHLGIP